MTITAMPTAKQRKTRTRTKRVSSRPPIVVSKMFPNNIDLLPGTESLVCPDCETWCPITGHDSRTPKLVPHHTGRAGAAEARRCIGSNRRVLLDLTIPEWHQLLADAIKETASRRTTNVLRKPKTPPAPAASQIKPLPLNPETARIAYRTHFKLCRTCTGRARCPEGERLAVTYGRLERQEPRRQQIREFFARERSRIDRQHAAQMSKQRAADWTKQASTAVKKSELAKRSGTAVEEASNQCKFFRGPGLPRKATT
jgi:hypothetical protein